MKKILAILVAVMMLSTCAFIMTSAAPPLRIGDVNLDGEINIIDLVRLKKASANIITLDALENLQADFDESGEVNADDLTVMRKAIIGVGPLAEAIYGDNTVSLNDLV